LLSRVFFFKFGIGLIALSLLLSGFDEGYFAYAQSVVFPSAADQSRERVPQPIKPIGSTFNFRLQSPERSPIPRAIDNLKFVLGGLQIEGSSIYKSADLERFYKELLGSQIVLEDVRKVAEKIEDKYRKDGYFLTRVFLPPQQVKDGIFTIRVIEGFIGSIQIEGSVEEVRSEAYERLQPLLNKKPIDLPSVERALLLLNDLPGVQGNGLLRAGRELGSTDLLVQLETTKSQGYVTMSNFSSVAVGPVIINFAKQFRSLLKLQDELTLQVGTSGDGKELNSASWRYAFPIGRDGLSMSIGSLTSKAIPGGDDAKRFKLESKVLSSSARLRYPLLRSRTGSIYTEFGVTQVESQTNSQETTLFKSKQTVRDLSIQIVDATSMLGVTQASIGVSKANSVNVQDDIVKDFDSDLKKYTYSLKHQLPLGRGFSAQLDLQGQWTDKPLLSSERIAFGGGAIGRGYLPSTIVGDRGVGGSIELGWSDRFKSPLGSDGTGQIFVFRDYARAEQIARNDAPNGLAKIHSSGVGIRWQGNNGFRSNFYWARPDKTESVTAPPKDSLYFSVVVPW
jgi:hemolysin activation/secretion protein